LAVPALGVDRQKDPQDLSRGKGLVSVSEQNTYQKNQVR